MPDQSTKLSTLERKRRDLEQLQAQVRQLEAREKERSRKTDTRRKIVAGGLILKHLDLRPNDPFSKMIQKHLDEFCEDRDRPLFGLPPLPPANDEGKPSLKKEFPG